MTEIEQKALALVNEVASYECVNTSDACHADLIRALRRAIEQHEQFKREVSDAVVRFYDLYGPNSIAPPWSAVTHIFDGFILPKPDPVVEAWDEAWGELNDKAAKLETFRAALTKRRLEVREIEG